VDNKFGAIQLLCKIFNILVQKACTVTCCSFLSLSLSPSAILDFTVDESQPKAVVPPPPTSVATAAAVGESKRKGQQDQFTGSSRSTTAKTKKEPDMVNSSKYY
jgi:hypothetical protein